MFNPHTQMRPSRVLAKLRAGEVAYMTKLNLSDPRAAEIAAASGFDVLWLCMEHTASTLEQIENLIRAAKMYDVDTMVRVPRGNYSNLIRPLELDAAGIMVPHCMSADDAEQVVKQTRFHPLGLRPLDGGNADGNYARLPLTDYMHQANEQRFVVLQIEDPQALDEVDAIAAVPGYDMLFFGAGDFSQAIGIPGQVTHPDVIDAKKRIVAATAKHGKFAGLISSVPAHKADIEMGYRLLSFGADVIALTSFWDSLAEDIGIQPSTLSTTGQYSGR